MNENGIDESGGGLSVRIGGEAGQGMNTMSRMIGKTLLRSGFEVFIHHDIMSRIRGGHNFSQIRFGTEHALCPADSFDILVCLDENTLRLYSDEPGGLIVFDPGDIEEAPEGDRFVPVPMAEIAEEKGGDPRMANSAASGAAFFLIGMDIEGYIDILGEAFGDKGGDVVESNRKCARAGYEYASERFADRALSGIEPPGGQGGKMLMTGSEAMAMGALGSGLSFYSAYPMSPATSIMEFLAARQGDFDIRVEQTEDEISAINMAIGASFAGARAMVGTSGGGMALMVEGISLAGMTETPVVIIDCQRPAPATGLPTRTEQADLLFAAHGAHGEFPRVILAPATAEEAFYLTGKALYLAEKYQTPVFVLGDQFLNDASWTVGELDPGKLSTERSGILSGHDIAALEPYSYKRYEINMTGISPRILPGTGSQVLYADSDEHTEEGHITESGEVRTGMVDKRLRKLDALVGEIGRPRIYPDLERESYVLSWGSSLGAVEEAVEILRSEDIDIGYIHFSELYPVRKDLFTEEFIEKAVLIGVENNATGQFARLLRMEAGLETSGSVSRYDGRPFTPAGLASRIKEKRGEIYGG
jgi:2-oxoglutarate ferredoxin oxidoreductase subunit alpha